MGLSDSLRNAYYKVEDKYYAFCDSLEDVKVPVYEAFVNPLEERGVPSFPVALLLILLIGAGIFFVAGGFLGPSSTTMKVLVVSGDQPIPGAQVELLSDGKRIGISESDSDGFALFSNVPVGKSVTLQVSKDEFEPYTKTFSVGSGSISTKAALAPLGGNEPSTQEERVSVRVLDRNGVPLGGVSITYFDSGTSDYAHALTDGNGIATLTAFGEDSQLNLKLSKEGFLDFSSTVIVAAEKHKTVRLLHESDAGPGDGGTSQNRGSAVVYVVDDQGSAVDATVHLYDADSGRPIATARTYSAGVARFTNVEAAGTVVYPVVEPVDSDTFLPSDASADAIPLVFDEVAEFRVQLGKKDVNQVYDTGIKVVDSADNSPIAGVKVKFYSANNIEVGSGIADSTGMVSFDVTQPVYVTAYKEGYLAARLTDVEPASSQTLQLTKAVEGNNADLEVKITDADGQIVAGAGVVLYDADGYNLGLPLGLSFEDGVATFTGLDVSVQYKAKASKGALHGESGSFFLDYGIVKKVSLQLEQPMGTLTAFAKDITTDAFIRSAKVQVYRRDIGSKIAECNIGASNSTINSTSCTAAIPAGKALYLTVASQGYLTKASEDFAVDPLDSIDVTVSLVPASLANETRVFFEGIREAGTSNPFSKNVTFVTKGSFYEAKFTTNAPSNAGLSGFFVRVSGIEGASAEDDVAALTGFPMRENALITKGATFSHGPDCGVDQLSQEDAMGRQLSWVNFEYENLFGSQTYIVKFFVKPSATEENTVSLKYRTYAERNNVYARDPVDSDYGTARDAPSKASCYARAYAKNFQVQKGRFTCNDAACISLQFARDDSLPRVSKAFATTLGENFNTYFEVRALQDFEEAPYLKLTADSVVRFADFSITDVSGSANGQSSYAFQLSSLAAGESVSGTISSKGVIPASFARVALEFGDANGKQLDTKSFIIIQGRGEFRVQVTPQQIQANEDSDLAILVTNAVDGSPITDATISLEEVDPVFDGTLPESMVGDGSSGEGQDGIYRFRRVHPFDIGQFQVRVNREGFREGVQTITVTLNDFIRAGVSSLSVPCNGASFDASNLIGAKVSVFASLNCGTLSGEGVTKNSDEVYTFDLDKKQTKRLTITPTKQLRSCNVALSSTLPSGVSVSKRVDIQVACSDLPVACALDADCPSGQKCSLANGLCEKIDYSEGLSALPDPVTIRLDENKYGEARYSIKALTGVTDCQVKSSEAKEDERMQNYMTVTCDTSTNVITFIADYASHPFYAAQPSAQPGEYGGYDPYCQPGSANYPYCLDQAGYGGSGTANCYPGSYNYPYCQQYGSGGSGYPYNDPFYCNQNPFTPGCQSVGSQGQLGGTYNCQLNPFAPECQYMSPFGAGVGPLYTKAVGLLSFSSLAETQESAISASIESRAVSFEGGEAVSFADSSGDFTQSGLLYITLSGQPTMTVRVKIIGPGMGGGYVFGGNVGTVIINSGGFYPRDMRIPIGGNVTWVNQDSRVHGVQSRTRGSLNFSSGTINTGAMWSRTFPTEGVYSYYDPFHTSFTGTITVGNTFGVCHYSNPTYFAKRFSYYLTNPLVHYFDLGGRGETVAASSPNQFYIAPSGLVTAGSSAFNAMLRPQNYASPNAYQLSPNYQPNQNFHQNAYMIPQQSFNQYQLQQNPGFQQMSPFLQTRANNYAFTGSNIDTGGYNPCKASGNGYVCDVSVSALMPVNGMAFTIINDFGSTFGLPTELLVSGPAKDSECLVGVQVERMGAAGKLVGLVESVGKLFGAVSRYSTYVIKLSSQPACVKYAASADGGVQLKLRDGDTLTQKLDMSLSNQITQHFTVTINFKVDHSLDKLGVLRIPAGASYYSRIDGTGSTSLNGNAISSTAAESLEPFYFVNNVPYSTLTVGGSVADNRKSASNKDRVAYVQGLEGKQFSLTSTKYKGRFSIPSVALKALSNGAAPIDNLHIDVVGNVGTYPEAGAGLICSGTSCSAATDPALVVTALQCSGNNYCTASQFEEADAAMLELLKDKAQVQRIAFNGFGDYARDRFSRAIEDLLRDFFADQVQYRLCGGVKTIQDYCNNYHSGGGTPNYDCYEGMHCDNNLNFNDFTNTFGDSLKQSLCDTHMYGALEQVARTGNWDIVKAILRQRWARTDPLLLHTSPIVDLGSEKVTVLFKLAADSGTYGQVLKSYALAPDQSSGTSGFMTLHQWVEASQDAEKEKSSPTKKVSDLGSDAGEDAASKKEDPISATSDGIKALRDLDAKEIGGVFAFVNDVQINGSSDSGAVFTGLSLFTVNKYPLDYSGAPNTYLSAPGQANAIKLKKCSIEFLGESDYAVMPADCEKAFLEFASYLYEFGIPIQPLVAAHLAPDGKTLYMFTAVSDPQFNYRDYSVGLADELLAFLLDERHALQDKYKDVFSASAPRSTVLYEGSRPTSMLFRLSGKGVSKQNGGSSPAAPTSTESASTPQTGGASMPSKFTDYLQNKQGLLSAIKNIVVIEPPEITRQNCYEGNLAPLFASIGDQASAVVDKGAVCIRVDFDSSGLSALDLIPPYKFFVYGGVKPQVPNLAAPSLDAVTATSSPAYLFIENAQALMLAQKQNNLYIAVRGANNNAAGRYWYDYSGKAANRKEQRNNKAMGVLITKGSQATGSTEASCSMIGSSEACIISPPASAPATSASSAGGSLCTRATLAQVISVPSGTPQADILAYLLRTPGNVVDRVEGSDLIGLEYASVPSDVVSKVNGLELSSSDFRIFGGKAILPSSDSFILMPLGSGEYVCETNS